MLPVLAQMMDRGDMGDGGGHWWWLIGIVVLVSLVGLMVFAIVRATAASQSPPTVTPAPPRAGAEQILAERLARGEIDPAEYRQRLEALRT